MNTMAGTLITHRASKAFRKLVVGGPLSIGLCVYGRKSCNFSHCSNLEEAGCKAWTSAILAMMPAWH